MIYVGKSKISGRGAFASHLLRPGRFIDTEPARDIGFNHSCEPNCIIVRDRKGHNDGVIALRFIVKGEELTVDYRHGDRGSDPTRELMQQPPRDCRPCKCQAHR